MVVYRPFPIWPPPQPSPPPENPAIVQQLQQALVAVYTAEAQFAEAVKAALDSGMTWDQIAAVLSMTVEEVQQIPEPPATPGP